MNISPVSTKNESVYLWLLPTVKFWVVENTLHLRKHATVHTIANCSAYSLDFMKMLNGNYKLDTLLDLDHLELLPVLENLNFLVKLRAPISEWSNSVSSRFLSYLAHSQPNFPDQMILDLRSKNVCIFGVGGIGSQCALGLLGSGVKTLTLVDPDRVELTNLNRQIFFDLNSIGMLKVEVARDFLLARFPDAQISTSTFNCDTETGPEFKNFDLVIIAGECKFIYDKPEIVGDSPVLRGGYDGNVAVLGPLYSFEIGCTAFRDVRDSQSRSELLKIAFVESENEYSWNSSGSAINSLLGGLLIETSLKILTGLINSKNRFDIVKYFDMNNLNSSTKKWNENAKKFE